MSFVNTMFRATTRFLFTGVVIAALTACGGGGGGDSAPPPSGGSTPTTTTISGKVTVPAAVAANKPGYAAKLMANQPHGKPGSKAYMASKKAAVPSGVQSPIGGYEKAFDLGAVWLYDADHPEWLYPVATADVVAGAYTLSKTKFSALNGNAYQDDQPIPAGNYTLFAYDAADTGLVALKVVVNKYAGSVVGVDLMAEPSDVAPTVQTILGAKKNIDGTATWGSSTNDAAAANYIKVVKNGAVQVAFSSAMNRISVKENITIKTAAGVLVDGAWQVSPDWKTAVFKPTAGSLTAGNYVITVQGKDTFPSAYVKNVYNNALAKTAKGYFTVTDVTDGSKPNAVIKLYLNGAYLGSADKDNVDVTTAIRVKSDELLDVSTLSLSGTPSLGAKPTASYIGKDDFDSSYPFVYEFTLGVPLTLATTYSVTVSGGKDLAGNAMNTTTYSFTTATTASGITSGVDTATQTAQAQVKDVFGKWVRAMSDRNMAQMQGLMTGGYVYEYDATLNGVSREDINADSRLSLNEFSAMLENAFVNWEYCGTTLTGDITADIIVSGSKAGMEFTLTATPAKTAPQCAEGAPNQKMYAVLEQVNGAWFVSRAAEGIDIRNKDLVLREVITLLSPAAGTTIATNPATFSWQPMPGVTSYLLLVADDRGQGGMAVVVPSTTTSIPFTDNTLYGTGVPNIADVTFLFGNNGMSTTPCVPSTTQACSVSLDLMREGATFKWEVMGLGTNTFDSFKNNTYKDVFRDIKAISALQTYKNAGIYLALNWTLRDATGNAVPYNEWYWAYDAGNAANVNLEVTSPIDGVVNIGISGSGYSSQQVTVVAGTPTTVPLNLYQGMNWVWMDINNMSVYLSDGFSITTTGGIPPVVSITSVTDNTGAAYNRCDAATPTPTCIDQWGYLSGTGANSVTISGKITVAGGSMVGVSNWNSSGAYDYQEVAVDPATGNFTVTMNVYNGDNWFNFSAYDSSWMNLGYAYLGINTTAGSVYVPPIAIDAPVAPVTVMADYGGSQDWDASNEIDNQLTITGTMAAPGYAQYTVSSSGNWVSGAVSLTGNSFSIPVTLYNGWNWISIDDGNGHWYGVNIYTSGGAVPARPVITTVAGQPFDITITNSLSVNASASGCTVTVEGTLGDTAGNMLTAYWYGYDGMSTYYEQATATSGTGGAFMVTLPVVGDAVGTTPGYSYNYIDLYDSQWNWAGAMVYETSGCAYVPPANTVTGLTVSGGGDSVATFTDYGGYYGATLTNGLATSATLHGSNTRSNKTISGYLSNCGSTQWLTTVSGADGSWSLGAFSLYGGYNYMAIDDGYSYAGVDVTTSNGITNTPAVTITSVSPMPTITYQACEVVEATVDMTGVGNTLTFSGVLTKTPGATGTYYASIGSNYTTGSFVTNADGSFTLSLPVFNGYNSLTIYDGNGNYYSIYLSASGGVNPPQALTITSPAHNDLLPVGSYTASGNIDPASWSAVPSQFYAYTYDAVTGTYTDYSSDPTMASYGYQLITVNPDGSFSLPINVTDNTNYTYLYVEAYDPGYGSYHGHSIYVNNLYNYNQTAWKPGARPSEAQVTKVAIDNQRKMNHMTALKAKVRDSKRLLRR